MKKIKNKLPPIAFDDADISKYRNYIEKEIPNYQRDNVVLFKERLKHIEEKHQDLGDIEKVVKTVLENPDLILTSKNKNTLQFIKSIEDINHSGNVIVKISTDDKQNSIITAIKTKEKRVQSLMKRYKLLYKK